VTLLPPLRTRKGVLAFSRPHILGVLNVTPDSFFDGGRYFETDDAVTRGLQLEAAGADLVDVGGESTRPGSIPVSVADEIDRVVPVVERLAGRLRIPISVDTRKADVAEAALRAGADLINDVSGLLDPALARVTAHHGAAMILGHLRGEPATMQQDIRFHDAVEEVARELAASVERAVGLGVPRERIVVDPGLGFGKTAAQTVALVAATGEIRSRLGRPVCVGPSRKSFLGALTGAPVDGRLMATAAAAAIAVFLGADIVRLHDVAELREVVTVATALREAR
jgi:dihydropteroate synthase